MTLSASTSIETAATAQEVMELVLDLERYKQVDSKILSVGAIEGPDDAGRGRVRLWSRLKWTPPAPDVQTFVLERWSRLTFSGAPRQPARLLFGFTGTVECEPTPDGTLVTHSYELRFRGPFRILERPHRQWFQRDLDEEMQRVSDHLKRAAPDGDPIARPG